ncbi:MAG: amidohydrolase [Planctomycetes bacterium]|nr:amidohydrolase [Planctomycetota bacterium]
MEFFDADTIIGRAIDQEDADAPTVDDLIAEMDRSLIARSLVTNQKIALSNPDWGNEDLARDITPHARLRGVFGTWLLQDRDNPPPDQAIDRLIKMNAAGVQLWPGMSFAEFTPWQCPDLLAALSDRQLPLFLHSDQASWTNVHDVLKAFPKLVLVLQRVTYGDFRKAFALMKICPNLHLCTSPPFVGGSVLDQLDRFLGCDRLLFGSGLFRFDVSPAAAQVAYSGLSDAKKAQIAGGNLLRLLGAIR